MSPPKAMLWTLVLVVTIAVSTFWVFQRQVSGAWLAFAMHPETIELLEASLEDQKTLADTYPDAEQQYRQRFDEVQTLLQRLRILEHNRREIVGRYERVLLILLLGTFGLGVGAVVWSQARNSRRLERLGHALEELAEGRTDLDLGDRRRDVIGRFGRMIERTSRRMAHDRRRLRSLENLSAWQEAARRHAHEMRTPLTGARLELERLGTLVEDQHGDDARRAIRSACQELDRLRRFTQEFTSFARLPRPTLRRIDLDKLLAEFASTFDGAWPNLELICESTDDLPPVLIDRDMLRQVLVNLCDNSSLAMEGHCRQGQVTFKPCLDRDHILLDVIDDGPGVAESVRQRLFEPYTTTRVIGKGMGLGLAICRKILLDHGGDLELYETSEAGTTFRLNLPLTTEDSAITASEG